MQRRPEENNHITGIPIELSRNQFVKSFPDPSARIVSQLHRASLNAPRNFHSLVL